MAKQKLHSCLTWLKCLIGRQISWAYLKLKVEGKKVVIFSFLTITVGSKQGLTQILCSILKTFSFSACSQLQYFSWAKQKYPKDGTNSNLQYFYAYWWLLYIPPFERSYQLNFCTGVLTEIYTLWQYRLSSFQAGYTKLERFLPKNKHT